MANNYLEMQRQNKGFKDFYRLEPSWYSYDVRQFCIKKNLYTRGNNEEYGQMLEFVANHTYPTAYDIRIVAEDIVRHSEPQSEWFVEDIENIADMLVKDAIDIRLGTIEDGYEND